MKLNEVKQKIDTWHRLGLNREETVTLVGTLPVKSDDKLEALEYVDLQWKTTARVMARYLKEDDVSKKLASLRKLLNISQQQMPEEVWHKVGQTLCDLHFIDTNCSAGMIHDLITDYNLVLDALPQAQEERQKERELTERSSKYILDLITYGRGDIVSLDIIPSVEPWSDEKLKKDSERIINHPTLLDKIRAFSQFVNSESHNLAKYGSIPGFCLQQAYNYARSGPVATTAEIIINTGVDDLLLLKHPSQRSDYNPHPALLKTLDGHTRQAICVSITPDGKTAVSGSGGSGRGNCALGIWDLKSGECPGMLEGHTDDISSVSITPDGKIAVSASQDKTVRVWDIERGECLKVLKGRTGRVNCVSITPDGRIAITGNGGHYETKYYTLQVWDLDSGECLRIIKELTDRVNSVSITPDGKKAVSASSDKILRIWDLESGERLGMLKGHTHNISCVSITPDGKTAVSGSGGYGRGNYALRIWDLKSGECLGMLEGHTGSVNSVSITPDGRRAVSGGDDNTLRIWDLESSECLKTFKRRKGSFTGVSVTADGRRVVSVSGVSVTTGGGRLGSTSDEKTLQLWNIESGECLGMLEGHTGSVNSVGITPDGKKAVSGGNDGTMRIWNLESSECLKVIKGQLERVYSVGITPDGRRIISGNSGKPLGIWDLESGECLGMLEGHTGSVNSVSITPDGRRAVSVSNDKTLRIWDLESGECLKVFEVEWRPFEPIKLMFDSMQAVCITSDGKRATSGSDHYALRMWNVESGECLKTFNGHIGAVSSMRITPDGKRAITSHQDTLRVWDLEKEKQLASLKIHIDDVNSINITPDAKRVVSGSSDHTLCVWDLKSGKCIAIYLAESPITALSEVRANGDFACGTRTGEVILLKSKNIPMEPPIVTALRLWLYEERVDNDHWDDDIKAVCQWCGQRFAVANEILDTIETISRKARLSSDQSPSLELPAEFWKEPQLSSECPLCNGALRLNPFVVDNKNGYGN